MDACSHAEPGIETYPAADTLSSVLALVAALMGYSDLPMDTHATCGMAFVLLAVLLEGTGGELHKVCFISSFNSTSNSIEQVPSETNDSLGSHQILQLY